MKTLALALAYLGPPGTFSEEAALAHGGPEATLRPFSTIPAVVTAVETGAAALGLLPLENSLEGGVTTTLDLLIRDTSLKICSELVLPIRHMLAARPGLQLEHVQVLHAHPQALGQSRRFVERCLPHATTVAALSNASALTDALADSRPAAAITTRRALELHPATLLARDIQDHPNNLTRFVVLGPEDALPTGDDRTSLCFATRENRAGALLEALQVLAEARINMTRLESRPAKEVLGEYIFLVDLEGHRSEPHLAAALERLRGMTTLLKIFGSYPRYRWPQPEPSPGPLPRREPRPLLVPPVVLEGHAVRLEPLALHHAPALAALCEEELFTWFPQVLRSQADVEAYISHALAQAERGLERPFVIIDRQSGEPLGSTRYMDIQREHRTLEIGSTWLARRAWRTRANTESKYLLLRHAFEALGAMRVALKTDKRNARSRAAIERLGARFEGLLRQHLLVRGGVVRDTAYYSILDTEWPAVKTRLEARLGAVPA